MKILAINPGSTSTKIAVYENTTELFETVIRHDLDVISEYEHIIDQYDFRMKIIIDVLKEKSIDLNSIDFVVGRGGLVKPIPGGVYEVNDIMIEDLRISPLGEHASNLGAMIAKAIASEIGDDIKSYIVNPVVVDEMNDLARFSGHPELPRISIFHALNQKAVALRYSREIGKDYEELNLVVVHLGGGITVGAHENGKVIDVNNGLDGEGPYSPERCGTLPAGALVKLCYSGKYQYHEVKRMITGKGGFVAYLNSNNAYDIELNSEKDEKSRMVFEGMIYQVAKEVGACSTVLSGKDDAIVVTGGIAHSNPLIVKLTKRVGFIAPVKVYPGEDEMRSLAESVYYASKGEQEIKIYI
jgi:butyrate kinase